MSTSSTEQKENHYIPSSCLHFPVDISAAGKKTRTVRCFRRTNHEQNNCRESDGVKGLTVDYTENSTRR